MAEISQGIKRFLTQANKKWQEEASRAKEEGGFERLDDGRYIGQLIGAEFTESKGGRPMAVTSYKIVEGDSTGETIKKFRTLDGDDDLKWFALEMTVFGYDCEEIHFDSKKDDDGFILNVLAALEEEKPVVKLRLSTKNDYQSVNVESLIEDYETEEEEEEAPPKKTQKSKTEVEKPKTATKSKSSKKEVEEVEEVEEELEEELEELEEEVELEVGMQVKFKWLKETMEGTVREIIEADNKVKVKVGSKIYPVKMDDILEIVEGETD